MYEAMGDWPLVGRTDALAVLRASLSAGGRGVLVAGEAGIGKTRLCDELAKEHTAAGGRTIRLAATRCARAVPLGALMGLTSNQHRADVPLPADAALAAVLEAATSSSQRLMVYLDDLHHADEATIAVLEQALLANANVFLLTTYRSHDQSAAPPELRFPAVDRLDLLRLTDGQIEELLNKALPEIDPASRAKLVSWAGGRPLYLRELVGGLTTSGRLSRQAGGWTLEMAAAMPARVSELVEARLDGLGPGELEALMAVCLSEPAPYDLLVAVVSGTDLERLEQRHLLRVDEIAGEALVRPAHPLHGDIIRARPATTLLRRRLARELAAAYAEQSGDVAIITRVRLLDLAGVAPDADLLAAAASAAYRSGDNALASELGIRAFRLDPSVDVAVLVAETSAGRGDRAQADLWYETANDLASTDHQHAAVTSSRARTLLFGGRGVDALVVIAAARRRVTDPMIDRSLRDGEAEILGYLGQWDVAHRWSMPSMGPENPPATRYAALCLAGFATTFTGPHPLARRYLRQASDLQAAIQIPTPHHAAWLVQSEAYLDEYDGRPDSAVGSVGDRARQALASGRLDWGGHWTMACALFTVLHGSVTTTTLKQAEDAVLLLQERDPNDMLSFAVSVAALAHAMAGHEAEAARHLERYNQHLRPHEQKTTVIADRAALWLTSQRRNAAAAVSEARAAGLSAGDRCPLLAVPLLHDVARLGHASLVADDLRRLAARLQSVLSELMAHDAAARAASDREALMRVARQMEEHSYRQLAADAYRAADRLGGSSNHQTLIERLLAEEIVVSPLGPDDGHSSLAKDPLTPRQREVATLAVGGATSAAIAEELGLSRRTIDRHLGDVYARLGIGGRLELARALKLTAPS